VSREARLTHFVPLPIALLARIHCEFGTFLSQAILNSPFPSVAPDPLVMAPFKIGDYIEYNGIKVGGEIICYAIVATSVQITTPPGKSPVYIRMEDAIIGVFDPAQTAVDEFGDTRVSLYSPSW
jgi:hypothetical protein